MNISVDDYNNIFITDEYTSTCIGSVCYKTFSENGHWPAYLLTDQGDQVIGQFEDFRSAVSVVAPAHIAEQLRQLEELEENADQTCGPLHIRGLYGPA